MIILSIRSGVHRTVHMLVEWVPGPPKKKHDLFRVDLLSGSGRVSGSGDLQENVSEKIVKPPCSEAALRP